MEKFLQGFLLESAAASAFGSGARVLRVRSPLSAQAQWPGRLSGAAKKQKAKIRKNKLGKGMRERGLGGRPGDRADIAADRHCPSHAGNSGAQPLKFG
jgi:hypothetical protein